MSKACINCIFSPQQLPRRDGRVLWSGAAGVRLHLIRAAVRAPLVPDEADVSLSVCLSAQAATPVGSCPSFCQVLH